MPEAAVVQGYAGINMRGASNTYVRQVLVAVGIATLAVLLVLALWMASHVLLLIFGGILLAVLLRGLGDLLSEYSRIPPGWSVVIVGLVLVAVFGLGGWYLSGQIAGEFDELGRSLSGIWQQVQTSLKRYAWGRDILATLGAHQLTSDNVDAIGKLIVATLGGASGLVISVFIGLYVAANPTLYRRGLLRLTPIPYRKRASQILDDLHERLRGWLIGTLVLMMLVGTAISIGLWLIGIPLALALGIIMFFCEFIPYLGPILGAIPAVLVATTIGTHDVLLVVLLYWGVQSVEGYVLSPLVFQRSVDVPPMITISAQVLLGTMLGILGIVFATPLAACAMVLVNRLYVEDALGDNLDKPLEA